MLIVMPANSTSMKPDKTEVYEILEKELCSFSAQGGGGGGGGGGLGDTLMEEISIPDLGQSIKTSYLMIQKHIC